MEEQKKEYICGRKRGGLAFFSYFAPDFRRTRLRRGARVVEEARLESVYTPKGYHEFESRSLRII